MEGSHSGLVRLLGKQVSPKGDHRFESCTLRRVERPFERPGALYFSRLFKNRIRLRKSAGIQDSNF